MTKQLNVTNIQGIVASGYMHLPWSAYLIFDIDPATARDAAQWVETISGKITTAQSRDEKQSLNIAFTHSGLQHLGIDRTVLNSFSLPFVDGMSSERRAWLLDDPRPLEWGNQGEPVDVLLMAFAPTEAGLEATAAGLKRDAAAGRLSLRKDLRGHVHEDRREHFGFFDGIAQPIIEGLPNRLDTPRGHRDLVKSGEFVLGYKNEYGNQSDAPQLGPDGELGKDGTYLVFRQTSQDVRGFWNAVATAARRYSLEEEKLAAKMIGRWKNGAPLVRAPESDNAKFAAHRDTPDGTEDPSNNFGFKEDPEGLRCPLGAHIRRANPRNGSLHTEETSLPAPSVRHRLLRRGRSYGPKHDFRVRSSGAIERGLYFIALCADLERQFEFVQQTWINNPAFNELDEVDPLVGAQPSNPAKKTFTIQAGPTRQRVHDMRSFVHLNGGAYFFVPSIDALKWLGNPDR